MDVGPGATKPKTSMKTDIRSDEGKWRDVLFIPFEGWLGVNGDTSEYVIDLICRDLSPRGAALGGNFVADSFCCIAAYTSDHSG